MTLRPSCLSWLAGLSLLALAACGGAIDPNDSLGQPVVVDGSMGGAAGSSGAVVTAGAAGAAGGSVAVGAAGQGGDVTAPGQGGEGAAAPGSACWQGQLPTAPAPGGYAVVEAEAAGCSLVGTWDILPQGNSYPSLPKSVSFDTDGRFVAGEPGADLCQGFTRWGFYTTATMAGSFAGGSPWAAADSVKMKSVSGKDLLSCETDSSPNTESGYHVTQAAGCDQLQLEVFVDSCTGGGIFRDGGTLVRRK